MSEQSITDARERHQRDEHPGDLAVCSDPACREASREINRERAISYMQRALRRKEVGERKRA
jgi:hypothetical protein